MRCRPVRARHLFILATLFALLPPPAREVAAQSQGTYDLFLSFFRDSLSVESQPGGTVPEADTCYAKYPDSLATATFRKVFDLYTSESVLHGVNGGDPPGWSKEQVDTFMTAILDADTTTSNDVFPRIWSYFCMADRAAAEDSVNYVISTSPNDVTYTRLQVSLYHSANFFHIGGDTVNERCDSFPRSYERAGYGGADHNSVLFGVSASLYGGDQSGKVVAPLTAAKFGTFTHELQHVADHANLRTTGDLGARSEFLSTAAEYVGGARWSQGERKMRNVNAGLYSHVQAERYPLLRLFSAYLFGRFPGDPDVDEDDLIYKLIRYIPPGATIPNSSLYGMGHVLVQDFPDSVEGADATEKMGNLYQQFALARFANDSTGAAGGIYGFGASGVSPRNFGWFEWTDTNYPRVNWIPPDVTYGSELLGSGPPVTVSTWTDPVDTYSDPAKRSRQLTVRPFGSEYFILRADSTLFTEPHTLKVTVGSNVLMPENHALKVGYIEYEEPTGNLFDQPLRRVVEDVPVSSPTTHPSATVEIPAFGDTTRAVVVVVSMVQSPLQDWWGPENAEADITVSYDLSVDTTWVPSDERYIQNAIDATSAGNVVLVAGLTGGAAHDESIAMKPGVRVIGVDSGDGYPILNAGTDTVAVSFGHDATPTTTIENFTLRGGTDAIVHLRGQGRVINCTLDGRASDPDYGIWADSTQTGAYVEDCSVALDSGIGVSLQGWVCDLTGCTIRVDDGTATNTGIEILPPPGTPALSNVGYNLVKVPNGTGICNASWWSNVTNCTIDSVAVGVQSSTTSSAVVRSIVSHHTVAGFDGQAAIKCISSGTGEPYGADNWTMNEYSVIEDPRHCDPSGGQYTLRADSYGAPDNNDPHVLIGAFGVACLQDTLACDVRCRQETPLNVLGDLVIPVGRTVTLEPGARLTIAGNDDVADLGADTSRVEILVRGALWVLGTSSQPDSIRSVTGDPGSWAGIAADTAGAVIVASQADLRDFAVGLSDAGGGLDSLALTGCTLANFTDAGVNLESTREGGQVDISSLDVHMEGAATGVRIDSGADSYAVRLDEVTVTGDEDGDCGITINSGPVTPATTHVNEITVSGLSTGTGFLVGQSCPRINDGSVSDCHTGVWFDDTRSGQLNVQGTTSFLISGCTTGLYMSDSASVTVDDLIIDDLPSGGIGLYTDYASAGEFTNVAISGGATGFKSYGTGDQTFRQGNITGFTTYGVLVHIASPVHLGDYDFDDPGNNNIYSTSGSAKYVYAKNHLAELGPVLAQANWWGEYPPSSTRFTTTTVDYTYALTGEYQMQRRRVSMVETRPTVSLVASPNPFRGGVVLRAEVANAEDPLRLEVFDVAGRLVRSVIDGVPGVGVHEYAWDGRDDRGTRAPQGLYFVRMRAGSTTRTVKILRLP